MSIGLVGAQRVGKTTLARAFSQAEGVRFVQTNTTGVFERLGLDPRAEYPFDKRLEIQWRILEALEQSYAEVGLHDPFITDRTPIDLMTYTLADIQRSTLSDGQSDELVKYMRQCFQVANERLGVIVLVQPGIPLVEELGKAQANLGFMEHFNALARGLLASEQLTSEDFFIPRHVTNLSTRVEAIRRAVDKATERVLSALGTNGRCRDLILH